MENTRLGNVRLIRKLGEGGMGAVWLGRHETLDKDVAVKILPPALARDETFAARFIREARSAARLEHPNVIQVLDADADNGVQYIVMQYVEGVDLQKAIKRKGPLPVRDCLSIVKRVAAALAAAHELQIIHRDVKPSNIMVTAKGRVFIGDFGLARDLGSGKTVTGAEQVVGTPHFMSPEQARGERLDVRSDIYSLGATFYAMLTGRPPFEAETPVAVMVKHAREDQLPQPVAQVNPKVPPAVGAVVARMMAKDPAKRFATMKQVFEAIDAIKDGATVGEPVAASALAAAEAPTVVASGTPRGAPTPAGPSLTIPLPSGRKWWIIGSVGLVAAIVAGFILFGGADPAREPFDQAARLADEAGDDPARLAAAADRFHAVEVNFPQSALALTAGSRAKELRLRAVTRQLDELRKAHAEGRTSFPDTIKEIGRLYLTHTDPALQEQIRNVLEALHRKRLAQRTKDLMETLKKPPDETFMEFVAPNERPRAGKGPPPGIRAIFSGTLWGEVVAAEPDEQAITLDLGREAAMTDIKLTVKKAGGIPETAAVTFPWSLDQSEWYLNVPKLLERMERDPRRILRRGLPPPREGEGEPKKPPK
jgi:predicted Ser/Thr protein kinase